MTNLDPILCASIVDIAGIGVALGIAGVKLVNHLTGPLCVACAEGDHDELADVWHGVQKCSCACRNRNHA